MTTATVTWLTATELERAAQALGEAATTVEDLGNFRDLDMALQSPLDEAPVPTVEQFAALSWFVAGAELEVTGPRRRRLHVASCRGQRRCPLDSAARPSAAGTWAARYYDEAGTRRFQGGFETKTEARGWLDSRLGTVEALRRGAVAALRRLEMPTLQELVDEYLAQHVCEENTKATLRARLKYATGTFGDVQLDRLAVSELRAWRAMLPAGSAWHIVKAARQVLGYAVAVGLLDSNPAKAIPNPETKRTEVLPFGTLAEVEAVAAELLPHYRALPLVGSLTGLRPSELFALERRDVDKAAKVLHVRRVLVGGNVRPYGKTAGALRVVPLAQRALEALGEHLPNLGTSLLFSTQRPTLIDLHRWRARHWTPALRAAGLAHRGPYAMRHTFASWTIAAGLPTFEIAATMGTSLEQLSKTYAHLLPDSADRARVALDAYLSEAAVTAEARR